MNTQEEPIAESFLRFLLGFLVFLGVGFGVTLGVNTYLEKELAREDSAQQAAALRGYNSLQQSDNSAF